MCTIQNVTPRFIAFYSHNTDLRKHIYAFIYIKNVIVIDNRDFCLSTKILAISDEFGVPYFPFTVRLKSKDFTRCLSGRVRLSTSCLINRAIKMNLFR